MSESEKVSKLGRAIPPKARLMIAISGVIIVGVTAISISNFSTEAPTEPGQVDIDLRPSTTNIDRARPDEPSIIPDESDIGQALADQRRQQLENALTGDGGSLTEAIRFPSQPSTIASGPAEPQSPEQALSAIDQLREARQSGARRNTSTTNGGSRSAGAGLNFREFIEGEIARTEAYSEGIGTHLSRIVSNDTVVQRSGAGGDIARSPSFASESEQARVVGAEQTTDPTPLTAEDYVNSFVRRPTLINRSLTSQDRLTQYRESALGDSPRRMTQSSGGQAINMIEAGTILYAVLDTGVDTDNTTHVRATIVQEGPFKGAKVLGGVNLAGDKVTLQFDRMGHDGQDYSINAVAVDPTSNEQQTALADKVDRHIVQRYGMLWGAAFLEGYADALTNTTTVTNTDGSQVTTRERTPDASDQALVAAGRVGARTTPLMERQFNRPPTVYVAAGRPIGLMLLQGLAY